MKKYWNMTNEELLAAYKSAIGKAMAPLKEAAEIWCEMENRGMDLRALRTPLTEYFPRIARGELLPETIFKFAGQIELIEIASNLVLEDQAKLAQPGATVPVMMPTGDVALRKPEELRIAEARQVFGDGRIREPAEQKPYVATPRTAVQARNPVVHAAPAKPIAVSPKTDTAMAAAFSAAGYAPAEQRLNDMAIQAWAKWPSKIATGARVNFVIERLKGELTWALMSDRHHKALRQEVDRILRDAEDSIVSARPENHAAA